MTDSTASGKLARLIILANCKERNSERERKILNYRQILWKWNQKENRPLFLLSGILFLMCKQIRHLFTALGEGKSNKQDQVVKHT